MGALHPQVVHFTIVLTIIGVAFRLVSLVDKPAFASPAATTILLLAAASSVVAVRSGTAAHGPVERAPGARPASGQSLYGVAARHPSGRRVRGPWQEGRGGGGARVRAQDISQPTLTTTSRRVAQVVESAG